MSKPVKITLWAGGALLVLFVVVIIMAVSSSRMRTGGSSVSYQDTGLGGGMNFGLSYGKSVGLGAAPESEDVGVMAEVSVTVQDIKTDRLIIKTGSLSMVVKDVKVGIAAIGQYAEKNGGFIVSSNVSKQGVAPYGEITIRIPVEKFDKGFADVKTMGQVESEQVNGQDVTEEYVDLTSQIKNLRAAEEQFLVIMRQAIAIKDILAVQKELTAVRGQIENIQGRMKYLEQSAKLSTLSVYLSTDPDVLPTVDAQDKWKPWGEVKSAARSLLSLGNGLANLVIWLVVYIPLWLVIGLAVWGVVKGIKWLRGRRV